MSTDVKSLQKLLAPEDQFVETLVNDYTSMKDARARWEAQLAELQSYLDATDTRTTTNNKLPFKNSTTINKISQIRENIVTAYMEHLIPNDKWVQWKALNADANTQEQRSIIEAYVRDKAEKSQLNQVVERLVEDYTVAGMFAVKTRHVRLTQKDKNGTDQLIYQGAVAERINPMDVVYDVSASTLENARKCIRSVFTLGGLKKHVGTQTDSLITQEQFDDLRRRRIEFSNAMAADTNGRRKWNSLAKGGFGDIMNYIQEGTVEVLTFYGDFYDEVEDELLTNYEIVVVDRRFIAKKASMDSWTGSQNIHIGVWGFQSNSLAPMGPLLRIVGLQFKLDKLENQRADIFDKIADPGIVETGDVRRYGVQGAPGFRYEVQEGGSVTYLHPPVDALRADFQIQQTMQLMEELAGAPREAIGQRTPGEKTAYEVQLLDSGQSKLFRRKVKKFESEGLTRIIQDYLELGRHNLDAADVVATMNTEYNVEQFTEITRDNLNGLGQVVARGATIFAEKANALQTISGMMNGAVGQQVAPHISSIKLARALERLGDLEAYDIITENVAIQEAKKRQVLAQTAEANAAEVGLTDGNITDEIIE